MNKQKFNLVVSNVFRRLGIAELLAIAWVVVIEFLLTLGGLAMDRDVDAFQTYLLGIPGTLAAIINLVLAGYFIGTAYADFKWAIQNGISRKTMWYGRLVALFLATLVIFIADEFLSLASQPFSNWLTMLVNFLALLTGMITIQAIGSGFGLLTTRWKWVVGIGLPVLAVVLLMAAMPFFEHSIWLSYQHNHFVGGALASLLNLPGTPWICWALYFLLMLGLTRLFSNHLQLRRA